MIHLFYGLKDDGLWDGVLVVGLSGSQIFGDVSVQRDGTLQVFRLLGYEI